MDVDDMLRRYKAERRGSNPRDPTKAPRRSRRAVHPAGGGAVSAPRRNAERADITRRRVIASLGLSADPFNDRRELLAFGNREAVVQLEDADARFRRFDEGIRVQQAAHQIEIQRVQEPLERLVYR